MKRLCKNPYNLFHLSQNDLNNQLIYPRVPYNFFTKSGYENSSIARISFAPTIDQCLFALSYKTENMIFNVYEPIDYKRLKIINNREIIQNQYVPDAKYSGEIWVINPIILKFLYKIKVISAKDNYVEINYGENIAKAYFWNWEKIE